MARGAIRVYPEKLNRSEFYLFPSKILAEEENGYIQRGGFKLRRALFFFLFDLARAVGFNQPSAHPEFTAKIPASQWQSLTLFGD